jgi:hypothetical protein
VWFFPDTLSDGVPKGWRRDFCHFCHPITLEISKVEFPGKGARRRVIRPKRNPAWKPSRAQKKGPMKERKGGRTLCSPLWMNLQNP